MPRGRIYKHETKVMHLNLPVPLHAALMEWSDASGIPAARFVVSVLADNLDSIKAMTAAAVAARAGHGGSMDELKAMLMHRIEGAQQFALALDSKEEK